MLSGLLYISNGTDLQEYNAKHILPIGGKVAIGVKAFILISQVDSLNLIFNELIVYFNILFRV